MTIAEIAADDAFAIAIGPFGSRMKSDLYVSNGVPVIRGGNIGEGRGLEGDWVFVSEETADELIGSNVTGGDLVFPHRGAIGRVALVPGDRRRYMLSTSLMKLRCNSRLVDPRFIYYYFRSGAGRYALLANTSTVGTPGIGQPLATLKSIDVPVPPLNVQRRSADILSALDDKIDLNRRLAGRLDDAARAIFQEWFISNPSAPSWPATKLERLFAVNPSRTLQRTAPAPYLDMANMPTMGPSALGFATRIPGSGARFENGDTLLARITPCLENGKTALVDFLAPGERGWGSTEYIVLRPREPLPETFAYCLARHPDFVSYAVARMNGSSGRQRVSAAAIGEFEIRTPPPELARRFGDVVRPMFRRIALAVAESGSLTEMRDALLPRLMSGKLEVAA